MLIVPASLDGIAVKNALGNGPRITDSLGCCSRPCNG